MFYINKIISDPIIDFAAEELKKYLRMMSPEGGDVKISYAPDARDGFRLGLMQDFGLDTSDSDSLELDDIIYIDSDERGGIIAGSNPRSVLLSVYEYFRQLGCRWLFPGVDGEYIPMKDVTPVKYRKMADSRVRGDCIECAGSQQIFTDFIDFLPKVGLNTFMIQFKVPKTFYDRYYNHPTNLATFTPEPVSYSQIAQWTAGIEYELSKRGLFLHSYGHGFTCEPFGISSTFQRGDSLEGIIPEESKKYIAEINGKRDVFGEHPLFTNVCMSNGAARSMIADYVVSYSKKHTNTDYLHVWLADGTNNHCECQECKEKTPSDWYIMLLNEIDEKLEKEKLNTRIAFICYVDTFWAPTEETLKNPDRFNMLFAPIHRSYAYSMPDGRGKTKLEPYKRNKNVFPKNLAESLDYFDEWKKTWKGENTAFEYHFWRHMCYYVSGIGLGKLLNDDVKLYKENGINGMIACGTQRPFFPNGLAFYSYARTLFDTSLTFEEILEDYYSTAYGEDWRRFYGYLSRLEEILPFTFFSRDEARKKEAVHYDPEMAKQLETMREATALGRELIKEHYDSDYRIRTVSVRLLEKHADFCELVADWMAAKARGELDKAMELYNKAQIESGKIETEYEKYFDHSIYFTEYIWTQRQKSPSKDDVVTI